MRKDNYINRFVILRNSSNYESLPSGSIHKNSFNNGYEGEKKLQEFIVFTILLLLSLCTLIIYAKNKYIRYALGIVIVLLVFMTVEFSFPIVEHGNEQTVIREKKSANMDVFRIADQVLIDAPVIKQLPELERGCEVTSLAMLLHHAGINVDKMELAKKIKKNPARYQKINGIIHYGDPNEGFVGDIYSWKKPGLGVYHKPIYELAKQFLHPNQVLDLTGKSFENLKIHLSQGRPIWVIINTEYRKLPDSYFETWVTPNGKIKITYKEHSVLITGYDEKYIFFNDPLTGKKNKKAPKKDFIASWEQMGRQAITYLD